MKKTTLGATIFVVCLSISFMSAYATDNGGGKPAATKPVTETAYIDHMDVKDGKLFIDTDYIDWYEGKEADKVFLEHEGDSGLDGAPDGYYIVNDSTRLRSFEVAPDAQILMQIYDHSGNPEDVNVAWNEPVSTAKFKEIYRNNSLLDISDYPFHLEIKDGVVVKIVQQYIP
ncbi:hypothetical protein KZ483_16680 [Paenibacillus sp. sptzw28]|uniref:hypothetical protein n=1 Tax=Paenibacillus sp. sptzw28 TaxID=715179 RepID=UPI001C6F359B|nr:hypothetical protein [Paenibacillus sp. sptzw28]QYR19541.1 hypothetical protein KZ483_16680 [Paenibacillus sp. sptzw28]